MSMRQYEAWLGFERDWPLDPPQVIVVCGSRTYTDRAAIRRTLGEYLPPDPWMEEPTVLHGGCRGADKLAHEEAADLGFWVGECAADWDKHGRAAGPIRNRQMLDKKPDLVIAFGRGRGTDDTVCEARKRGIPVREVDRV